MYSQQWSPTPSTTAIAPEFRTAKRSPARPVDIKFAARRAVEQRVADDGVVLRYEGGAYGGHHADASAAQPFAHIVVRLALQAEVDAADQEGTEALTCGTFEADVERVFGQSLRPVPTGNRAREHRAHRAVGVGDGIVEEQLAPALDGGFGLLEDAAVQDLADGVRRGAGVAQGVCRRLLGLVGQTAEVKERGFGSLRCLRLLHLDEVGTPDDVVQLREAHLGKRFPYLFGKEVEEVDEVVGPSVEALPQLLVLSGDAYRQVFRWHLRIITHPSTMRADVAKPYSSAPSRAMRMMSRPVFSCPSVWRRTCPRRLFITSVCCVSDSPNSGETPA